MAANLASRSCNGGPGIGRFAGPLLPRRLVTRPRVVAHFHRAIGAGVTAVVAPAGYGKTTAVALAVAELDFEPRWLILDATCRAPEALASQLARALTGDRVYPEPATAGNHSDLHAYLGGAIAETLGTFERPLVLVIDNVHELAEAPGALGLLSWLRGALQGGHELVFVGRDLPFMAGISEGIATGELPLIGPDLLAFTEDEVAEAVRVAGASIDAAALHGETGGWPVAVMARLAGETLPGVSLADFERYLEGEVWAAVPRHLQFVLHRLSLLPTLDRTQVEVDYGLHAWRELAAWLSRRDFLCEQLSPREFRLNPILRRFIQSDFARNDPEGFAAALDGVLSRLVRAGRLAEAIELACSEGSGEQVARLLEAHGHALLLRGSFSVLKDGFHRVEQGALQRSALLAALAARVTAQTGDPESGLTMADSVLARPDAHGAPRVHARLARLRALRLLGRAEDALAEADQLRAIQWCGDPALAVEVSFHRADVELSIVRNFARAESLLRSVVEEAEAHHVSPLHLLALSTLGQALAMHGDVPAAVTVLARAAQGWRSVGRTSNLGWTLNNLGMAHLDAGDFESAATVLQEAVQEGLACGNRRNVAYATASLGDAELALGRFASAQARYEEAVRICASEALDETLAALAIAGLSAALLGQGDVQQADFFARRAMLVAMASRNPYDIAVCRTRQAAVELAAGNAVAATALAEQAAEQFEALDVAPMAAVARYRAAMAQFRAGRRSEAQASLQRCAEALRQPWMTSVLVPLIRENPMFAQWAASRPGAGRWFREILERQSFEVSDVAPEPEQVPGRLPRVVARSLGRVVVSVGGRHVSDEQWASTRAKELFFLLLAHRDGLRKEQAVELLYPELPREKCNSAFHSNLYRVRRALYQDCVVKQDGTYLLNPEGQFEWDVEQFEAAIERGRRAEPGSKERALAFQEALELYEGPFAEVFESEWAAARRTALHQAAHESLAALAGYFAARRDYEAAALCLERILRADRFNEEAAYELARYRSRAGQTVQALQFIDQYAADYEQEMGAPLPERFAHLRAAIASGRAV